MIYPSHYSSGAFGLEVPDQAPYETVLGESAVFSHTKEQQARDAGCDL